MSNEIDSYIVLVPIHVTASSERMALAKVQNALYRHLPMPCAAHDGPCDCVGDDPAVILSGWDLPLPETVVEGGIG